MFYKIIFITKDYLLPVFGVLPTILWIYIVEQNGAELNARELTVIQRVPE